MNERVEAAVEDLMAALEHEHTGHHQLGDVLVLGKKRRRNRQMIQGALAVPPMIVGLSLLSRSVPNGPSEVVAGVEVPVAAEEPPVADDSAPQELNPEFALTSVLTPASNAVPWDARSTFVVLDETAAVVPSGSDSHPVSVVRVTAWTTRDGEQALHFIVGAATNQRADTVSCATVQWLGTAVDQTTIRLQRGAQPDADGFLTTTGFCPDEVASGLTDLLSDEIVVAIDNGNIVLERQGSRYVLAGAS